MCVSVAEVLKKEEEEEEARHPDGHHCEQVVQIGKSEMTSRVRRKGARERKVRLQSEVSGDGLQGVSSRTMDVHILERGMIRSDAF